MARAAAFIVHQVGQRLRFKVPSKRGDAEFFTPLAEQLAKAPQVEEVTANPVTGSVVVRYLPGTDARELFKHQDLIEVHKAEPQRAIGHNQGPSLNIDSSSAWSWGLSLLAVYQAARGYVIGSAAENFWNARSAQRMLNSNAVFAAFAAAGAYQVLMGNFAGSASSLIFYAMVLGKSDDPKRKLERGEVKPD